MKDNDDVEALLIEWLASQLGDAVHLCSKVPDDVREELAAFDAVVQVTRFGGADRFPKLDEPNVDVDSFALTDASASAMSRRIHTLLRFDLKGALLGTTAFGRAQTITGPAWRPYDDTNFTRYNAAYQVPMHQTG